MHISSPFLSSLSSLSFFVSVLVQKNVYYQSFLAGGSCAWERSEGRICGDSCLPTLPKTKTEVLLTLTESYLSFGVALRNASCILRFDFLSGFHSSSNQSFWFGYISVSYHSQLKIDAVYHLNRSIDFDFSYTHLGHMNRLFSRCFRILSCQAPLSWMQIKMHLTVLKLDFQPLKVEFQSPPPSPYIILCFSQIFPIKVCNIK